MILTSLILQIVLGQFSARVTLNVPPYTPGTAFDPTAKTIPITVVLPKECSLSGMDAEIVAPNEGYIVISAIKSTAYYKDGAVTGAAKDDIGYVGLKENLREATERNKQRGYRANFNGKGGSVIWGGGDSYRHWYAAAKGMEGYCFFVTASFHRYSKKNLQFVQDIIVSVGPAPIPPEQAGSGK